MADAAIGAHELYLAYLDAGFTDPQAMYLTAQCLTAAIRNATQGAEDA
jgi:hypothetical protein